MRVYFAEVDYLTLSGDIRTLTVPDDATFAEQRKWMAATKSYVFKEVRVLPASRILWPLTFCELAYCLIYYVTHLNIRKYRTHWMAANIRAWLGSVRLAIARMGRETKCKIY